jgi:hypothetical protein
MNSSRSVAGHDGLGRSDLRMRIRAAVIAALLGAGCSGSAGTGDEQARTAAVGFLDDVRAGRLEPAWQASSTEFKSLMGLENLRDYVKTHSTLKTVAKLTDLRRIQRNGQTMAECRFSGTSKQRRKDVPAIIKVLVAAADEGWKVEQVAVE